MGEKELDFPEFSVLLDGILEVNVFTGKKGK